MRGAVLVLLFTVSAGVAAQAPDISPKGDPSVQSDTIYTLAVDPAEHEGE